MGTLAGGFCWSDHWPRVGSGGVAIKTGEGSGVARHRGGSVATKTGGEKWSNQALGWWSGH